MAVGIDAHGVERRALFARERVEFDDLLDLVAKEADPPGDVLVMRGEDFEIVAAHPEMPPRKADIVAFILHGDQFADDFALVGIVAARQIEDHRRIGFDRADAIDARDGRHDDHIVAFEQGAGGRVAHPVDRLVDRAFLLDIGVGARDIGFGLVVIIIGYEEFDGIVGEEAFHLAV